MADCVSKLRWLGVNQNKIKILRELETGMQYLRQKKKGF